MPAERYAPCGSWAKAEENFQLALTVARQQQGTAGSDEHGWFTEGFDALDLKEAKVLLGELA